MAAVAKVIAIKISVVALSNTCTPFFLPHRSKWGKTVNGRLMRRE